jgi:tetrahydromethanopterin S-methyltransferase subunit A
MTPGIGQTVAVLFRNGYKVDGTVISWSENKSILKSLTGASIIVIQKTLEDVMLVKINSAQEIFEELKEKPIKEEADIKTLAQMKIALNELEREEIKEKLSEHKSSGLREVSYGTPGIFKVGSAIKHTGKEVARQNSSIDTGLQDLFGKKY